MDFFIFLLKFSDFFLFCILCNRFLMTFQAGINIGHPGEGLSFEEAVADVTLQPLAHMFLMVEGDRLLNLRGKAETDEEKE
jgi:hypothetical protein